MERQQHHDARTARRAWTIEQALNARTPTAYDERDTARGSSTSRRRSRRGRNSSS
jgi:hypothetical protein